jgi:hypothetical protein
MRLSAYFSGSAREKVSKADNAFEFGITTILGCETDIKSRSAAVMKS